MKNMGIGTHGKEIALVAVVVAVGLLIAITLVPTIANQVATATGNTNVTSGQGSLLGLISTVFIAGLVLAALTAMFFSGSFGGRKK